MSYQNLFCDNLQTDTINGLPPGGGGGSNTLNQIIPWTNWQYFIYHASYRGWCSTVEQNLYPPVETPGPRNFGSTKCYAPVAGVYRFSITYGLNNGFGILHLNVNNADTFLDCYSQDYEVMSYVWTQNLVQGENIITFDCLTKNEDSSYYQIIVYEVGLSISYVNSN